MKLDNLNAETTASMFQWFEQSPVCTIVVDREFKLRYMSSAGAQHFNIDCVEDYYGQTFPLKIHAADFKSQVTHDLEKVLETAETVVQEVSVSDQTGDEIWYRSTLIPLLRDNVVNQVLIVSVDITDQKQTQIALQQSCNDLSSKYQLSTKELSLNEERHSLALRGANDGLWDWDLENDKVYYSPRWKSMLGYEENELEDTIAVWDSLVHPEDKDRILQGVEAYLSNKSNSFEFEMRMMHKNGRIINVLSRAYSASTGTNGKPTRLVGTHVDITERIKAEAFSQRTVEILEMIALGSPASEIYDAIALMYEARHPGLRCSLLELENGVLLHGGAPSMPKEYCNAVHGLKNGPEVGSCGTSTYWGKRCIVKNIETDPKWAEIKKYALPHGMRCCWSEPIKDSVGVVLGAFGMYYDYPAEPNQDESDDLTSAARLAGIIMERDHHQKQIHDLAYIDQLTGLASRAHFYQYLDELIKSSKLHDRSFSLIYIDLDNFKDVNDSLGHDCGDKLLKTIADRLVELAGEVDFISRISGDEFCVVVEDVANPHDSARIAQHCMDKITQPANIAGRMLTSTCSAGISHFPADGETTSSLVKAADTALYSAKYGGKKAYAFYEPKLSEQAEYRFKFEQFLREAIDDEQMTLVFQPQVSTRNRKIIGVEALCRWHHPILGQVSPIEFIEAAERIGMIKPLTEWVLKTACSQALYWKQHGYPELRVAVNISPSHFLDKGLVSLIERVIGESGIDPSQLELEVTESVVQTNQKNLSVFNELKRLGILLAIDDFGTGYSSFASLKHIEVDYLKIDKYFIDDMVIDEKTKLLVASMVDIGHNLGHGIIAEGVEDSAQLNLLDKMGCDTIQGYLFSKPVDADSLLTLLKSGFVESPVKLAA